MGLMQLQYFPLSSYFNLCRDELKPLSCEPRRWDRRERGTLDDVLSGTSVTLIDSLDTLAVLNDTVGFQKALQLIIR
jgi:hypothetical protein